MEIQFIGERYIRNTQGLSDENNETDTLPVMQDENDDYESRIRELGIKLRGC